MMTKAVEYKRRPLTCATRSLQEAQGEMPLPAASRAPVKQRGAMRSLAASSMPDISFCEGGKWGWPAHDLPVLKAMAFWASRRNERKNEKKREHKSGHEMERIEQRLVMNIVTWNVQRMTMREHNRRRLRCVCERIQKKGWEVMLSSELKAD